MQALGGGPAASGVIVSRESAMGFAPWWRAMNLISSSFAKLPPIVYRITGPRSKEWDLAHPAFRLLSTAPNHFMSGFVWRRQLMFDVLSAGNHYSYIHRDEAARPIEIIPLRPESTWPVRELLPDGRGARLWFLSQLNPDTQEYQMVKLRPEDVIHVRNIGWTGLLGMSVIAMAREALGLGMGAHEYQTIYFRNGGSVGLVLEVPASMS